MAMVVDVAMIVRRIPRFHGSCFLADDLSADWVRSGSDSNPIRCALVIKRGVRPSGLEDAMTRRCTEISNKQPARSSVHSTAICRSALRSRYSLVGVCFQGAERYFMPLNRHRQRLQQALGRKIIQH